MSVLNARVWLRQTPKPVLTVHIGPHNRQQSAFILHFVSAPEVHRPCSSSSHCDALKLIAYAAMMPGHCWSSNTKRLVRSASLCVRLRNCSHLAHYNRVLSISIERKESMLIWSPEPNGQRCATCSCVRSSPISLRIRSSPYVGSLIKIDTSDMPKCVHRRLHIVQLWLCRRTAASEKSTWIPTERMPIICTFRSIYIYRMTKIGRPATASTH